MGYLKLLEAAKAQGVGHFLFASNEALYRKAKAPAMEEETVCRPGLWEGGPGPGYAILKLALEKL